MNFGREFSMAENKEFRLKDSWIPVTPEKPILAKSHQGNQTGKAEWPEHAAISSGYIPEMPNYNTIYQNLNTISNVDGNAGYYGYGASTSQKNQVNHNVGSYTQSSQNGSTSWNNDPFMEQILLENADFVSYANSNLFRGIGMAAQGPPLPKLHSQDINIREYYHSSGFSLGDQNNHPASTTLVNSVIEQPVIPKMHSQVENSWRGPNLSNLLLSNQNYSLGSNPVDRGCNVSQIPHYGLPVSSQHSYNLNSPPRIEADALPSINNLLQFIPVTPDQARKSDNNQHSSTLNSRIEERQRWEKNWQDNLVAYNGEAKIQQHWGEGQLQNIVDMSCATISTPYKENKDSDKQSGEYIDPNTTPQQKPPRRRKHRPKVIKESKPKRNPKPAVPKNTEFKESNPGKRKYVRKKPLKGSTAQHAEITMETIGPHPRTATKTCRKVLNFDLDKDRDENLGETVAQPEELQETKKRGPCVTSDSQARELCSGTKHVCMSAVQGGPHERLIVENEKPGQATNANPSVYQRPNDYNALPYTQTVFAAPPVTTKDRQMKDFFIIRSHKEKGNTNLDQNMSGNQHTPMQQHIHAEGKSQDGFQGKADCENLENDKLIRPSSIQSVEKFLPKSSEERGSKRKHWHTIEKLQHYTTNLMGSAMCKEVFQIDECHRNGYIPSTGFSQHQKKMKIGNDYTNIYKMPSSTAEAEDWSKVGTPRANDVNPKGLMSNMNSDVPNSKINNIGVENLTGGRSFHSIGLEHNLLKQQLSSQQHIHNNRMESTNKLSRVHSFSTETTIENCKHLPPSPPAESPGPGNKHLFQTLSINMLAKKQAGGTSPLKSVLSCTEKELQEDNIFCEYQPSTTKRRGRKKKHHVSIDDIINQFNGLTLDESRKGLHMQEPNAIVPYKGDGAVVPYDMKKHKPRPKVDLDPETDRVWKLLMGKEGDEGLEETNKEKEIWWENERKVFRGRVDSFIAQMHLVQGDRRFSRWKGSVVDSVIGVFLTQNVTDHVSSSAFMSLAARFPLKSTSNKTQDKVGPNTANNEPEISIINPEDTTVWHGVPRQPIYKQSSPTLHESGEHKCRSETSRTIWRLEEEFISSQESFDSSITQGLVGSRSSSGSNSEASQSTGCGSSNIQVPTSTLWMENMFQEFDSYVTGSSVLNKELKYGIIEHGQLNAGSVITQPQSSNPSIAYQINPHNACMEWPAAAPRKNALHMTSNSKAPEVCLEALSEESISSWPSTASRFDKGKRIEELADISGNSLVQQNGLWRPQKYSATNLNASFGNHSAQKESIAQTGQSQPSCKSYQCKRDNTLHLESTSAIETIKLTEALIKTQDATNKHVPNVSKVAEKVSDLVESNPAVNTKIHKETKSVEQNFKEQICTSNHAKNETNTKLSKAEKGNATNVKINAVDWDNLRKGVETNGRRKERRKDAMDSIDYEAVRLANVEEIAEAIRERGMNNMLAERIKEFLNRLVREHGSTDLEWLRDVPPDQAKDYLLSIRGLGLKSVECVRLLTLHHLAFPVDTNVGRIVVRLGWVPLQPLPETLQLHLLELYPVLESVQKYLWPRLCKLDQRTLYELHYQMITFGKVFCTKQKPNCNACPMRGDCRHFASAFASARLALPGPEEKSIVSSIAPTLEEKNPALGINISPLPPPENKLLEEADSEISKCEPIIEVPATPEPECTEVSQSDIEDLFNEDPDEIPTIKLNMEEFTIKLQDFMQTHMELQEGDMSKALVALNTEVASIPTPKLKNVSRLRTEHHVYELPDSHPLLEKLDRREHDDPSPYLLAIWTPGETANSIQPPERRCSSQEPNKLCNEKTCFSCNSIREANSQTVRGTILIPCRTAMRGSFPLNGTYFQVNEVFADHDSSDNPIDVPREWIWNLPRRIVYFGTSVTSIFKGLSTEGIQYCFWKGFVCVRGFDRKTRAPRPLIARLHFAASKLGKTKND
ncbi:transcriptional activator DEMETER isoform X1 [Ziziphus jujuba]|uniref:Transcriptional activator DEMETER isoform X1 n=1 Tax=Ziziphus jujuba TaxID=326968 RepID=A0ABM3IDQ1_ZIZJJ|nr:transcriptional activator DEMETER isoform X1 [Ziziphus jujuba]XP_048326251.2 transcriptional activator DEMETER isoform X1 [Ziziphus jujuba]XP_048326252.2 transcriptional activator DEMETER isoform X1 [Ziziphus jujuba]